MLITKNLSVKFNNQLAIKNVNTLFKEGTITSIIGPSGCGKSTFLKSINRLHDDCMNAKVEGQIVLNGSNIYDSKIDVVEIRRKIGMVFQKPNPFMGMSILENITIGIKINHLLPKNKWNEAACIALTKVGLWNEVKDKLHHSGLELSGGQQQRLCMARALAVSPQVLLMDEPTSALDPIATNHIEELILKLKDELTIIMVTHNLNQAKRTSDQTLFFHNGECIEMGSTENIFNKPIDSRTEEYINSHLD